LFWLMPSECGAFWAFKSSSHAGHKFHDRRAFSGEVGFRFAVEDGANTKPERVPDSEGTDPRSNVVQSYFNNGDHAGSDANPGVLKSCSLRPLTSTVYSDGPPFPPGSRKNMITRPFGDQVGPSL
jgi:hypothetical protein